MRSHVISSLHSFPEFAPALQAVLALLPFVRSGHLGADSLLLALHAYVPHDDHSYYLITEGVCSRRARQDRHPRPSLRHTARRSGVRGCIKETHERQELRATDLHALFLRVGSITYQDTLERGDDYEYIKTTGLGQR